MIDDSTKPGVANTVVSGAACRVCRSSELSKFLSLGSTPLANAFLTEEQLGRPEARYPLEVFLCGVCSLVQLVDAVPPEKMFQEYPYLTGANAPMKIHFRELASALTKLYGLTDDSLVVEIGSNDGTLLGNFGCRRVGVEPASNVAMIAREAGVDTVSEFLSDSAARMILNKYGPADVVIGTNVFAHVDDVIGLLSSVQIVLKENGSFVIEVPYLVDMLDKLEFDTIYHEHLSYFGLRPLERLLSDAGMTITHVERVDVHGGSVRVHARNGKNPARSGAAAELVDLEITRGLDSPDAYREFASRVLRVKDELLMLLSRLKSEGARIAGYGAPAKGNTLLNFTEIGRETLDYILDTTPLKQGRYTPGTHIPVVSPDRLREDPPDYFLLLAWNYTDDILRRESAFREHGGKFIVPVPEPAIV